MSQVVTKFGGSFSTTDGLGNSVAHSVSTPAELASYNDWLSGQIGNWLVPVANGGEGLTQAQAQQRYDSWMGLALTQETATRFRAMAFDYLAVAADLSLVMQGAAATLRALRTQEGSGHVHTLSHGTYTDSAA